MATVAELGQKVKSKYPGQYDDMDDATVGQKVKAKFPGSYDDFSDEPTGILEKIGQGVKDFTAGIGSGAISTGVGAYNLARKIPGVSGVLPEPNAYMKGLTQAPASIPGQVGHIIEQGAEYMLPGGAAKGAGLLTRMGVNAAEAAAVNAVQTGGDNPMGTAGVAGLGAAATAIPAAVGVAKRIAQNPEARDAAIEMLPKGKQALKVRDILAGNPEPTGPPQPFRPNPAISAKTSFGGPGPSEAGNVPGKPIQRGAYAPPVEEVTGPPQPFKPNPRIAAKTQFGGPGPSEAGNVPGRTVPRGAYEPPSEGPPEMVPNEPFKTSPRTAAKMRYGGPNRTQYGPAKPMAKRPTVVPAEVAAAQAEAADVGNTPTAPVKPNAPAAAQALADEMKRSGTAPAEQAESGISRAAHEAENRRLKLDIVEKQLRQQGVKGTEDLGQIPTEKLDQMFRDVEQHRAGYHTGDAKLTRDQLAIRFGAPTNLRNPNIPARAEGGVAIPKQPDTNSHLPDSAHDGPPSLKGITRMAKGGVVVPKQDGPPTIKPPAFESGSLAQQFKAKGGLTHLRTSNLPEALQMAQSISNATGTPISSKSKDLHGWKLGDGDVSRYIRKPNAAPPKGESLASFKRRALSAVKRSLADLKDNPDAKIGLVTHHRVLKLVEAWVKAGARPNLEIDRQHMASAGNAGQVLRLHHKPEGGIGLQKVDMAGKGKLQGGVHLIAHDGDNAK